MTEVKVPIVSSVELFDDEELMGLADAIVRGKPLTDHHLQSANHLYSSGLKDIITRTFNIGRKIVNQRNSTEEEKKIARIDCALRFTDIYIKRPFFNKENAEVPLTPMVAMRTGRVYGGSLSVDFDVEANAISADGSVIATRKESVSNYAIANVPIIKGSILCHTYGKTDQELKAMNESICDPGGYLIFGHPYAIDNTESTTFNRPKVYFTTGNNNGVIRLDFLSKAGDSNENSDMLIITYHNDNRITIQINRNKLSGVQFPFFILFRILGWADDKTIFDHIVQDYNDETNGNILKILKDAMNAPYGTVKDRSYVDIVESMDCVDSMVESIPAAKISYLNLDKVPNNRHIIIEEIINTIDTYFLPHIGTIPDVRNQKLRFLAMLVRKILKVFLGVSAPTDRDSYTIKRMNTAGDNLSKTIKQIFGRVVAASAGRAIVTKFRELPFNMVPLAQMIKNSIKLSSFENFLNQIIATSRFENSGLGNQLVTNRLGAQRIEPKNITHQISTLRQVSSNQGNISSKQSDRSVQMRQVHNSGVAYICPIHSPPEGAGVGTKKQLALGAEIARPSQSVFIRMLLRKDEYVIVEENVLYPADISTKEYAYVYVNGNLVGYTQYPYYLVDKYRKLRRQKQIDIQATIYWDTSENEVHFFVDIGRMTRLITIVYNNKRDECFRNITSVKSLNGTKKIPKSAKSTVDYATAADFENFFQYTLLTKKDIEQLNSGKKTIANLIDEQKIEYISTEEQNANCFICPDIARLNQECYNPERPYTHVDIPQLLLGITALKVPYGSHNQVTRNVYATSHVKQACSLPVDNWPYNTEKGTFVMTTLESPVVTTFIDNYLPPSGNNTIIAINCSHGENQEDSIVMAKGAVERGLFSGAKYNTIDVILDPKETIGIPNEELTDKKKSGNFSKLTNGIVQPGVIIENGDIVIAKFTKMQNLSKTKNQKTTLIDKSIRYDKDTQGIIVDVLFCDNANERCIKIKYVKICELEVGDKLCLLPTAQVLTSDGWKKIADVTLEDKVATNKCGYLEYVKPEKVYKFDHNGYMYRRAHIAQSLNDRSPFETICTFNHKHLDHNFMPVSALEMIGRDIKFAASCKGFKRKNDSMSRMAEIVSKCVVDAKWRDAPQKLIMAALKHGFATRLASRMAAAQVQQAALECGFAMKWRNVGAEVEIELLAADFAVETGKSTSIETAVIFDGNVHCLEIPVTHNFYYKEHDESMPIWTNNSSRAGQKGILGRLLKDSDMPTTTTGIRPDIIFNPHGIPTRMTIGTLIETLVAKVCAIKGANYDGTFFKKIDIGAISDMLEKLGYNRHGYEYLIDGMTGEYIRTAIFMGPNFYQRLLKFVADTQYCVTHPKMDAVTRQPRDGQGYKGGLRIGEMERDVIMSHGSASILAEKYGNHSDGIDEYICRCGTAAIVNTKENIYKCNNCGDAAEIFKIKSTWAAMMFREEIKACGIGFKLAVDPIREVTSSNHFETIETYTSDVTEKLSRMHMTANGINTVDIPID